MSQDYDKQIDYIGWVKEDADSRQKVIEKALKTAFKEHIETREVDVIIFSNVKINHLADALLRYPKILKSLFVMCNIGSRAIERDLSIKNINTYNPRLDRDKAISIATYLKQFLPPYVEIPTLTHLDRIEFVDKEIRKIKGQWEKLIINRINNYSDMQFKKRLFESGGEKFEIDGATPIKGDIKIGIDIKRIEARRDVHKRCDEIENKAKKLKSVYPDCKFGAVIYYPFVDEHTNVQHRLNSEYIDSIVFTSSSKEMVDNAVRMLLNKLGVKEKWKL